MPLRTLLLLLCTIAASTACQPGDQYDACHPDLCDETHDCDDTTLPATCRLRVDAAVEPDAAPMDASSSAACADPTAAWVGKDTVVLIRGGTPPACSEFDCDAPQSGEPVYARVRCTTGESPLCTEGTCRCGEGRPYFTTVGRFDCQWPYVIESPCGRSLDGILEDGRVPLHMLEGCFSAPCRPDVEGEPRCDPIAHEGEVDPPPEAFCGDAGRCLVGCEPTDDGWFAGAHTARIAACSRAGGACVVRLGEGEVCRPRCPVSGDARHCADGEACVSPLAMCVRDRGGTEPAGRSLAPRGVVSVCGGRQWDVAIDVVGRADDPSSHCAGAELDSAGAAPRRGR